MKHLYCLCFAAMAWFAPAMLMAATPSPETLKAFDRYIQVTETALRQRAESSDFLYMDRHPELKAKARAGEILVEGIAATDNGRSIIAPNGMIQDWLGMMFVPRATIADLKALLQNYDNYKNIYKPEVIESREISRNGDEFNVFMRLYRKLILTVVLNVNYQIEYFTPMPNRMYVIAHSTRIAEVDNPKRSYTHEYPVENDTGFLWRLNSYWRVEQADGGIYAELESVSLSRDIPTGLGWVVKGFLTKMPRQSMLATLEKTRDALDHMNSEAQRRN